MHGQGTLTSSKGWSFTGALARNRPTAGVLTEASGRHFTVTYAADCAIILYAHTPATKVRACVCVPMRVREGPAAHGASAHTAVLSLTLSRFLSLAPSLYRCLFLCLSLAVARTLTLSSSLFRPVCLSPPSRSPLSLTLYLSLSLPLTPSPALSRSYLAPALAFSLSLFRSFSRSISLSHMHFRSLSFFLSLSLSLSDFSVSLFAPFVPSFSLIASLSHTHTHSRTHSFCLSLSLPLFSLSRSLALSLSLSFCKVHTCAC